MTKAHVFITDDSMRRELLAANGELVKQRDALLAALEAVEWVQHNERYDMLWCPSCHALVANPATPKDWWKHTKSCKTQATLATVKGEAP